MSQDNAEIVRRWLAAVSASPQEAQAGLAESGMPTSTTTRCAGFRRPQPRHGLDESSQFLAEYLDAYSRYEWAIQELITVGDDRVLACTNLRAEGRGSGMKLEGGLYQCYWLRHGRFFRVEDHLTLPGALRALGLTGQTLEAAGLRE